MSGTWPPGPDRDDAEDRELVDRLGPALGLDPAATPPADRVTAVRAAAAARAGRRSTPRRALLTGGVAAGVGGVAGYLVRVGTSADDAAPPAAVPTEPVELSGEAEVTTAELVNHTWGTELVLDVAGLAPARAYDVVFTTRTGEVAAGSLLAVPDVVMRCRFSAAPLRADVLAVEVRDPDGVPVLRAELPAV